MPVKSCLAKFYFLIKIWQPDDMSPTSPLQRLNLLSHGLRSGWTAKLPSIAYRARNSPRDFAFDSGGIPLLENFLTLIVSNALLHLVSLSNLKECWPCNFFHWEATCRGLQGQWIISVEVLVYKTDPPDLHFPGHFSHSRNINILLSPRCWRPYWAFSTHHGQNFWTWWKKHETTRGPPPEVPSRRIPLRACHRSGNTRPRTVF